MVSDPSDHAALFEGFQVIRIHLEPERGPLRDVLNGACVQIDA